MRSEKEMLKNLEILLYLTYLLKINFSKVALLNWILHGGFNFDLQTKVFCLIYLFWFLNANEEKHG